MVPSWRTTASGAKYATTASTSCAFQAAPTDRATTTAAAAVVALGGSGAVLASASALPGDSLYPVNLAVEDARRSIVESSGDAAARAALQSALAHRRLEEAQAMAASNRLRHPH